MNTAPVQQLHLFFATENDRAVILRRARRLLYQLILWHRDGDRFEPGQWIKREVLPETCALSPDGRHLLFSVYDGRAGISASEYYTALSRPPYFTALALFANAAACGPVGGSFLDNRHYVIADMRAPNIFAPVEDLAQAVHSKVTKDCRTGLRTHDGKPVPLTRQKRSELLQGAPPQDLHLLDRYDTQGGRLYRRDGQELDLIADFGEGRFEQVCAPYESPGRADGAQGDWHPLDGDRA